MSQEKKENKSTNEKEIKKEPITDNSDKDTDIIDYSEFSCGYVMPISDNNDYPPGHWLEMRRIFDEVCVMLGLKDPTIVSESNEVNIIHANIVRNLFENDIIICDVSSKNPNVMFELGLRIAFDKPVVIIKDDGTDYCFDTGTIQHISYPKDLRYESIKKFKEELKRKIESTLTKYHKEPNESPILELFGSFKGKKQIDLPEEDKYQSLISTINRSFNSIERRLDDIEYGSKLSNFSSTPYRNSIIENFEVNTIKVHKDTIQKNLNPMFFNYSQSEQLKWLIAFLNENKISTMDIVNYKNYFNVTFRNEKDHFRFLGILRKNE